MSVDAVVAGWLTVLVPALPFGAALLIGIGLFTGGTAGERSERSVAQVAGAASLGVFMLVLVLDGLALAGEAPRQVSLGTWFAAAGLDVEVSFLLDRTALGMATVTAVLGGLVVRFCRAYLHRETGFHRFYMTLCLFLSGMLLLALAGNAVLAFVGWELCGLASYLLIGYNRERPAATENATFAFLSNRVGDGGFLLSVGLAVWWLQSVEWPVVVALHPDPVTARMLAFGLVVAALVKSAQVPFSAWIARALEGPTPSSAVFYGSVMVHAGVFLVIRLEPLLRQVPDLMVGLALAGFATSVYAYLVGLTQSDVKSSLLYGTLGQTGLMFLACGLGAFDLAAVHLVAHAVWRAYQFLLAPSWLALMPAPDVPAPGWLRKRRQLYVAALQRFWLDNLALSLLARPTQALGRDMARLDGEVLDRLAGAGGPGGDDPERAATGVPGRMLASLAQRLQRFEDRLLTGSQGGTVGKATGRVLRALALVESLLEQPRYLMLMVMATFVVIL